MRRVLLASLVLAVSCAVASAAEAPKLAPGQKWCHIMSNLLNDGELNKQIQFMQRAAKAGYNGLTVNDVKMIKYSLQPAKYAENLKKFRQACTDNKLSLVACVMPVGYAENILALDPNLAEGMPVRDALFVVKDGKLVPDPSESPVIVNPSFEDFDGDKPKGWEVDGPGAIEFVDQNVKASGKASMRITDPNKDKDGRARLIQTIKVKPWHYYHVSVMVKTQDSKNKDIRIMALGTDGVPLNWQPPPVNETMDWTKVDATFASLANSEVRLYIGTYGPKTGSMWWDDVAIEPGGFVNIIRRDSLPLTVKSLDGKTTYAEGKDFSEVKDKKLVNDPNPGYFTDWHAAPTVTIAADSRLKEGDKVLASYNFATASGKPGQLAVCMSEPKLYDDLAKEIAWIRDNVQPDAYFMAHDEIRIGGWDDTCAATGKTPGQILGDNGKKCTAIIEKVDPGKSITVWNDMFDPHHNARNTPEAGGGKFHMYLTKGAGPWWDSWKGLPKQVGIINWSGGKADSFKFWAEQGHQQIISGDTPKKLAEWLKTLPANPGVVGVMYTTWVGDFGKNFEAYVDVVKAWEKETGGFKP